MHRQSGHLGSLAALLTLAATSSSAQDSASEKDQLKFGDVQLVIGQKIWAATWDIPTIGARVELPPNSASPVIQTSIESNSSSTRAIPLTVVSASLGDFTTSISGAWNTNFSNSDALGGRVKRSEYDISLGYSFAPNISASLIYKAGRVSQIAGGSANALLGFSGNQKLSGWLIGLSAGAPLQNNWSIYGNAAVSVTGKSRLDLGKNGRSRQDASYQIGEVGLIYAFPQRLGAVSAISFQIGYRAQVLRVDDASVASFSTVEPGALLNSSSRKLQSTTQGFIVGISGYF